MGLGHIPQAEFGLCSQQQRPKPSSYVPWSTVLGASLSRTWEYPQANTAWKSPEWENLSLPS